MHSVRPGDPACAGCGLPVDLAGPEPARFCCRRARQYLAAQPRIFRSYAHQDGNRFCPCNECRWIHSEGDDPTALAPEPTAGGEG